jgi:hypothetical protein
MESSLTVPDLLCTMKYPRIKQYLYHKLMKRMDLGNTPMILQCVEKDNVGGDYNSMTDTSPLYCLEYTSMNSVTK